MGKQRRILGYRLSRHAVKGGSGNFPICQGLIQVRFIDNAAPGHIDQNRCVFHALKSFLTEEIPVSVCRTVQGNNIRRLNYLVHGNRLHIGVGFLCRRKIRIRSNNLKSQRDLAELTAQDFIDVVRLHAEDGVDFVTLHCGITRKTIEQIRKHKRKMNIVSRGGSLVFAWMSMTGNENPFYEHFDEICEICAEHDVTISLGDACRPGCLADATDVCQIEELVRLGELTKRAWAHNVQVMVEGPGHVPLNQVAANMEVQKSICMGAPFYVLGPLVTDIAPGYDHITAAIGGAVAAMSGAAFLCYVTPAEHLALPNVEDVKQGIVASKIAAHAADIAKGIPHARDIDDKMGDARRVLDWDAQFACALDPETAKAIRDARLPEDDHSDTCSMCGKFCAVRSMNKALAGEYIDIL